MVEMRDMWCGDIASTALLRQVPPTHGSSEASQEPKQGRVLAGLAERMGRHFASIPLPLFGSATPGVAWRQKKSVVSHV